MSRLPLLLLLAACTRDYKLYEMADEPLVLVVSSPTYGEFTGSREATVVGEVSPLDAVVKINGEIVEIGADGSFTATVAFPDGDRAMVLDVTAFDRDESDRLLIPVFDESDPRLTDPGAISGLFTPTGLDGLEPLIAQGIDDAGWQDQIAALLPAVDTDYFDIVPVGVTSDPTDVSLVPVDGAIDTLIAFRNVEMTSDVVLLDTWSFPVTTSIDEILFGASTTLGLDRDDMLTLGLRDPVVDLSGFGLSFGELDIPSEIMDLLVEPLADLVSQLGVLLLDLVLDQAGELALGGPFAFDTNLFGTTLSARLAEIGVTPDGVGLGLTIATDGPAADTMPDLPPLEPTTRNGVPYQFGLALHEGLLNTLLDDTLSSLLQLDLVLDSSMAEILGAGIRALPGGDQMPAAEGMCIGIHAQDAQVVRFVEGEGAPLAQVWMPDLHVNIDTVQGGTCTTWLDAQMVSVVNLNLRGSTISTDLDIRRAYILSYGATGVDEDAVGNALGSVVSGLAYLLMSQLSFDLSDILGGSGLPTTGETRLIGVEQLPDDGRYAIQLDVL